MSLFKKYICLVVGIWLIIGISIPSAFSEENGGVTEGGNVIIGQEEISQMEVINEINLIETEIVNEEVLDNQNSQSQMEDMLIPIEEMVGSTLEQGNLSEEAINETQNYENEEKVGDVEEKLIEKEGVVLYSEGQKVIEAEVYSNSDPGFKYSQEIILESNESWFSEVVISSREHFNESLRTYADVLAESEEEIYVYWIDGETRREISRDESFGFESFKDAEGMITRVSWIVPHLSTQTFEIRVIVTSEQNESGIENISSFINITSLETPSSVVLYENLGFSFKILSSNISSTLCNFSLRDGEGNEKYGEVSRGDSVMNISVSKDLINGSYYWSINCIDENNDSIYSEKFGNFSIVFIPSTPQFNFSSDKTVINKQQTINFYLNVSLPYNDSISYLLVYGDGIRVNATILSSRSLYLVIPHIYTNAGNYTAELDIITGGLPAYYSSKKITVNTPSTSSGTYEDDSRPKVTVLSPNQDEIISNNTVKFRYKVVDESTISNCTLSLFYYPPLSEYFNSSSSIGTKVFSAVKTSVPNNTVIEVNYSSLSNGNYSWRVSCLDSWGNVGSSSYLDFSADSLTLINYSQTFASASSSFEGQEDVDKTIESINLFLEQSSRYGATEQEVMEQLEIFEKVSGYKKRILLMKADLQHNLDFIIDTEVREKRRIELLNELSEIKYNVPKSVQVIASREYSKNRFDSTFSEIISSTLAYHQIELTKSQLKLFVKAQEELQKEMGYSANLYHVNIAYEGREDEFSFVSKKFNLKNSTGVILEYINEGVTSRINNISFINSANAIKTNSLYEIPVQSLVDSKIIYTLNGFLSFDELQKGDSFILGEVAPSKGDSISGFSLTGFATYFEGISTSNSWIFSLVVGVVFLVILGVFGFRVAEITKLKKVEEVKMMMQLIEGARESLIQKSYQEAKELYREMQQLYPHLPSAGKKMVYPKVSSIRTILDKKESAQLARECLAAFKDGRTREAETLYKDLQLIYPRLPGAYADKIYTKLSPYIYSLKLR